VQSDSSLDEPFYSRGNKNVSLEKTLNS
jgi:hypothetical protein